MLRDTVNHWQSVRGWRRDGVRGPQLRAARQSRLLLIYWGSSLSGRRVEDGARGGEGRAMLSVFTGLIGDGLGILLRYMFFHCQQWQRKQSWGGMSSGRLSRPNDGQTVARTKPDWR